MILNLVISNFVANFFYFAISGFVNFPILVLN